MSRHSAYRLRNRLKGQPFDIAWEAAFRHGYDDLAHAALDRALNGVEVPHYCSGERIGTAEFDERLTSRCSRFATARARPCSAATARRPEWRGERWDALLERIKTGSVDWSDEHTALGPAGSPGSSCPMRSASRAADPRNTPDEGTAPRYRDGAPSARQSVTLGPQSSKRPEILGFSRAPGKGTGCAL